MTGDEKVKAEFATRIRDATCDGQELIDFALEVLRSGDLTDTHKWKAFEWLADRGYGKSGTTPPKDHENSNLLDQFDDLSPEQIAMIEKALSL